MNVSQKRFLFLLRILCVVMLVVGMSCTVFAADGVTTVNLKTQDESTLMPFHAENLFPGDTVSKEIVLEVKHKDPLTVFFHADIRPGYEKLAEVLMMKVELPAQAQILYDGRMLDMPPSLAYEVAEDETEVLYRLSVYLTTDVGNDYQYQSLVSDFRWWFLEQEPLPPEIPDETQEPAVPNVPPVTEEPEESDVPPVTEEPEESDIPPVTEEPEESDVPPVTEEPEESDVPAVTEEPEESDVPPVTEEPEESDVPAVTEEPEEPENPPAPLPAYVKFVAEIIVDGQYPTGRVTRFQLTDGDGNVIETVWNDHGVIEFKTLVFGKEGSYIYHMQELDDDGNVIPDGTVYTFRVDVYKTDDGFVTKMTCLRDGAEWDVLPRFVLMTDETEQPDRPSEGDDSGYHVPPTGVLSDDPVYAIPDNEKTGYDTQIPPYLFALPVSAALAAVAMLIFRKTKKEDRV